MAVAVPVSPTVVSTPFAAARVTGTLLGELRAVVGRKNVLHESVDLQTYEYDAYGERSLPGAVVFMHSTAEVSRIVKILDREKIPFVPRGYGTNLSGGSLALNGAVVLEMGHMNKVLEVDIPNQCVTVQPGIFTLMSPPRSPPSASTTPPTRPV